MGVSYLLGLLLAALPERSFRVRVPRLWGRAAFVVFAVAAAALPAVFALEVWVFNRAILEGLPAFTARLPIRIFCCVFNGLEVANPARTDQALAIVCLETFALTAFLWTLGSIDRRLATLVCILIAVALSVVALAAPGADSADPYLYVGHSLLGLRAYDPPSQPFTGEFAVINRLWGTPILPSAYGPVWVALSASVLSLVPTLAGKLFALRALALVALAGCGHLVRALRLPGVVVAAILCNPALYSIVVAGARNDILAVDAALVVALSARSGRLWAVIVSGAAAALIKVTLLPVALVAAAAIPSTRKRLFVATCMAAIVAAVYVFGRGGDFWHALLFVAQKYGGAQTAVGLVLQLMLAIVALGTSVAAILFGRVRAQSAWSFLSLGQYPWPSYELWGLPIAVATPRVALAFLVSFPLLTYFQGTPYGGTRAFDVARAVLLFGVIGVIAYGYRPSAFRKRDAEA